MDRIFVKLEVIGCRLSARAFKHFDDGREVMR